MAKLKIDSQWGKHEHIWNLHGYSSREDFYEYLNRQESYTDVLNAIIRERWRVTNRKKRDYTNPSFKDAYLYHEGYLAALEDITNILPRP